MPIPTKKSVSTILYRGLKTSTAKTNSTVVVPAPKLRCTNIIHSRYKLLVLRDCRKALTEYLHCTKGLPFFFADQIAANSLFCLSDLTRGTRFSAPAFLDRIRTVLRYYPINEFEFFFESIGIEYAQIGRYLPRGRFFLSDGGGGVLEAAAALARFGFPWKMLGRLYTEQVSIFAVPEEELTARLCGISSRCGFSNLTVVGACLAFPCLLVPGGEAGLDSDALFEDLKRVFEGFDDGSCVEGNVDGWYEVCCKIRVFYEMGCERGSVGEFMCRGKRFFVECPIKVLEDKANYFSMFCVGRHKVGSLLLRNPELLAHDIESTTMSVYGLLEHFGIDAKALWYLTRKFPHVFGRNKMVNLPNVMRALDLHEWLFDKIESSGSQLLLTYAMICPDQDVDKTFQDGLKKIQCKRSHHYTVNKLDFLMGLGFGENASTIDLLRGLHATCSGSVERFAYLQSVGIKYSEVCLLMKMVPGIFCESSKLMERKVNYLCKEMGSSVEYLYCFPRFLLFDLENRIKPRHLFYVWLRETGLYTKNYSIQSILDVSEKRFIARVFKVHPAAPKRYLECFLLKSRRIQE